VLDEARDGTELAVFSDPDAAQPKPECGVTGRGHLAVPTEPAGCLLQSLTAMLTEKAARLHRETHAPDHRSPQGVVSCALCTRHILWFAPLANCCEFHLYYDI
jgi:hypothetical protein